MSKTVTQTAALLRSTTLAGCNGPKTLYQREGYQAQVHEYSRGESKEAQAQALEADLGKIRAKSDAAPPGYHTQLGLLYSSIGKDDQTIRELETEKALLPEPVIYMDFLLNNVHRGAC